MAIESLIYTAVQIYDPITMHDATPNKLLTINSISSFIFHSLFSPLLGLATKSHYLDSNGITTSIEMIR